MNAAVASMKQPAATDHSPGAPLPTLERLRRVYTRPDWRVCEWNSGAKPETAGPFDAIILDSATFLNGLLDARRSGLLPLGRVLIDADAKSESSVAARLADPSMGLSQIGRVRTATGAVFVAEFTPAELDFAHEPRRDVRLGYYKMSRYAAYHQMQAAVAEHLPEEVGRVIEIGDTNHVIREMLGWDIGSYMKAPYPEHDLQDLLRVPDASCDVFICDNTLEHVQDPAAGLRSIHRVLSPGGHAVFMLPYIAMAQPDDRCRWSPLAFGEALEASGLETVARGAWGNVDACCAYIRHNKWLRVRRIEAGEMVCEDSRDPSRPRLRVPLDNDPAHPIHLWVIARRGGADRSPRPNSALTTAGYRAMLNERRARVLGSSASREQIIKELGWYQHVDELLQGYMNELAAAAYDNKHPKHWLWKSHKQFILDRVKPGERVLDVGCGASAYLSWMAEKGVRVTACDIREDRIALARSIMSHPNLSFELRDVTKQPPRERYDTVICAHVIEHLDDPVSMLRALRENAPRLIVAVPRDDSRWQKVMFRDLGLPWKDDEDHRREYTPELLREQLEQAGWRVVEMNVGVDLKAVAEQAVPEATSFVDQAMDHASYLSLQRERSERKKNYDSMIRSGYLARKMAEYLTPGASTRVLCVGARNHCELDCLEAVGYRNPVGIDLHSTDRRIRVMDMHRLEFTDGTFDGLFTSHSFEHARDPKLVAGEMRRVLKPGGVMVIEIPTGYTPTGVDLWDFRNAETVASYFQPVEVLWSESGPQLDAAHQRVVRLVMRMA